MKAKLIIEIELDESYILDFMNDIGYNFFDKNDIKTELSGIELYLENYFQQKNIRKTIEVIE